MALLATVVYDGFSQTGRFFSLEAWFLARWHWLGLHVEVLDTLLMVAIVALFVLAYLLVCGSSDAARAYAPTLIPIAAVYFAAHYFAYLLLAGQTTLGTLVDPFGHSWNPWGLGEYPIRRGIAPADAGLVVAGRPDRVGPRRRGLRGASRRAPSATKSRRARSSPRRRWCC